MINPNFRYYLNFARVGGFHLQAEPLGVIKLDASSREAGAFKAEAIAFKAEAIVNYASALITQQMEASGSPRCLQGEK
jgi:hypothetical protein